MLVFTISYYQDAPISVEFGEALARYTDETKLDAVGRILLTLGQRFIGSTLNTDDDEWDD